MKISQLYKYPIWLYITKGKINGLLLVVDDLIATGGTAMATAELCHELGASEVHIIALIDLPKLGGSKKLAEKFGEVITLLNY